MLLVLAATPAAAQTPPAEDPPAEGAATPAEEAAAEPAPDDDAIVVTGIRRSLESAKNIKRRSDQIIDAIVAEDIGKLPDIAVSDTVARIPGFQIERQRGEGSRVLLRGLDENFYTTTYNGREIFTAERRQVALQDFPAGGIAAIEAFKTSTANLVEPGLTGLVNVRSRRPFDFKGFEIAGSVWGVYPNQSEDFMPSAQLLVSNRWDVGSGELGVLLNASITQFHYQDSIRRHGFFVANLAGGRSPDWPEIQYNEGTRKRPSVNGALQWRNNNGLELYAEVLWQGYRDDLQDRYWQSPLWSCGAASYSNVVIDSQGRVVSGSVTNPGCPWAHRGWQGATKRKTDTYQFAVGGSYDAGPLKITADLARTTSRFNLRVASVDWELNTNNFTLNWFTGHPGGSGPTFEIVGIDLSDPQYYNYRGFYENYLTAKGKDWQGRLDFEYDPDGLDFLKNVQWGVRYVDRDASRVAGDRYWGTGHLGIGIGAVPLDYQLFHPAFNGDNNRPTPTTWPSPTFNSIWDNLRAFRQYNVDLTGQHSTNDPANQASRSFDINEKSLAGYGQLNFNFETPGGIEIGSVLGLRVVRTKDTISGTRTSFQPAPQAPILEPIEVRNSYTDWLPNANLNIRFSPQWQLRLAATKTRLRPQFEQLNPSFELSPPDLTCSPSIPSCVRTGSGGNPFLSPLTSTNLDASLEYYFSRTGFAAIAAFRRDMKGFIVNRTFTLPDPDPETGLPLEITGPENTNKGRIQGIEAQFSTFFDWDWVPTFARGFGVQANLTYLDPKIDLMVAGAERRIWIPDVSKWTYNLVAMYEAHGLTARLSYNRRSSFPEGAIADDATSGNGFTRQGRGNPVSRLDWSSSYNVTDNFTVFFDWTNILKKPFKSDIVWTNYTGGQVTSREIFPMVVRYEESVISAGVRFRFGGARRASAPVEPVVIPPPAPVAAPPVEQPAPPPPPPPPPPPREPSEERG